MKYTRPLYLKSPQMYGDDVKAVQQKLNSKGFNCGSPNGYFGPNTKKAVQAFQKKNGLTADGSCGPATWQKLFGSSGGSSGGGNLGTRIYVNSAKGNSFTLSVHKNGDYNSDYRMYSHGPAKSSKSKTWYKNSSWQTNSTKEIKLGIEGMNRAYSDIAAGLSTPGAGEIALEIVATIATAFGVYITPGLTTAEIDAIIMRLGVLAKFIDVVAVTKAARSYGYHYVNTVIHWNKI